jgi:hypothetical protein
MSLPKRTVRLHSSAAAIQQYIFAQPHSCNARIHQEIRKHFQSGTSDPQNNPLSGSGLMNRDSPVHNRVYDGGMTAQTFEGISRRDEHQSEDR